MPYSDAKETNILAMMVSLHRHLAQQHGVDRERAFFTHSLQLLTTVSGKQVDLSSWTITSYEVEFKRQIGYGGLYGLSSTIVGQSINILISGQVYEGKWNKISVALKVLRAEDGVTPSSEVCCFFCQQPVSHT
jgi:hypothetical protein